MSFKDFEPEIEIILHEEDRPVEGNISASGDDDYDAAIEQETIERLNSGDLWAWCRVEVKATFGDMSASDFLGSCSYAGEQDFKQSGDYEGMVKAVTARLYDDLMARNTKTLTIRIDCGKITCEDDGVTCEYLHSFEGYHKCTLFPTNQVSYTLLEEKEDRAQRCRACLMASSGGHK